MQINQAGFVLITPNERLPVSVDGWDVGGPGEGGCRETALEAMKAARKILDAAIEYDEQFLELHTDAPGRDLCGIGISSEKMKALCSAFDVPLPDHIW